MAQTTYLAYLPAPSGKRLVVQAGTHAFANTAGVSVTLVVAQRRVISSLFTAKKPPTKASVTAALGMYPFITKTYISAQVGTPQAYRVLVERKVAGNATKFAYVLVGY